MKVGTISYLSWNKGYFLYFLVFLFTEDIPITRLSYSERFQEPIFKIIDTYLSSDLNSGPKQKIRLFIFLLRYFSLRIVFKSQNLIQRQWSRFFLDFIKGECIMQHISILPCLNYSFYLLVVTKVIFRIINWDKPKQADFSPNLNNYGKGIIRYDKRTYLLYSGWKNKYSKILYTSQLKRRKFTDKSSNQLRRNELY